MDNCSSPVVSCVHSPEKTAQFLNTISCIRELRCIGQGRAVRKDDRVGEMIGGPKEMIVIYRVHVNERGDT